MTTYLTDSEGKFIPATQRPDGTWRKARRVRNGYVPQEEVPLYESKGKQFAQRKPTLPPGLHPVVSEKPNKTKKDAAAVTPTSNSKNFQQQALPGVLKLPTNAYITSFIPVTTTMTPLFNTNKSPHSSITSTTATITTTTTTTAATTTANNGGHKSKPSIHTNSPQCNSDLAENFKEQLRINEEVPDSQKRMKKLRKKLREIEQIEEKMKSGALKSPEKDQLDKVKRKKQIQKELKQLEAEQQQQLQPTTEVNEGQQQQQHTT